MATANPTTAAQAKRAYLLAATIQDTSNRLSGILSAARCADDPETKADLLSAVIEHASKVLADAAGDLQSVGDVLVAQVEGGEL